MKIFSALKIAALASASVYFARANEDKQVILKAVVAGHEETVNFVSEDFSDIKTSVLLSEVENMLTKTEQLTQTLSLCDTGEGHFSSLNTVERGMVYGAFNMDQIAVKQRANRILDELKTRFV